MDRRHQMTRYARQMILPEVGQTGQARLGSARILVVGAGGLGVPVLQYLAGAGIGEITVTDPDVVEESNLHRQPLYGMDRVGQKKAGAAKDILTGLNPDCHIIPRMEMADPDTLPDLLAGCDVALDCADSFAASYALSDACHQREIPLIHGSALGLGGYAGGFCGTAPSLRAVFPDLPETAATCATAGVLGPVVGLIGSLQAQMALAVLLELEPSPLGQMVQVDAGTLRFSRFRFDNAPEPAEKKYEFVGKSELRDTDTVWDLRGVEEAPIPATSHARRTRIEDIGPDFPKTAPDHRTIFACRTGLRAWRAAPRLHEIRDGEIRLLALGDSQKETK